MKAVIQRVRRASISVDGSIVGEINHGLLIYLGVKASDSAGQTAWLADKIVNLRIFDASRENKTTHSLKDIAGAALVVSQFTLLADVRRGRRPSFSDAADPEHAQQLFMQFVDLMRQHVPVQTGVFGADMQVSCENDGPFTLVVEHPPTTNH